MRQGSPATGGQSYILASLRHANANSDSYTDGDSNSHADSNSDGYTHSDPNGNANSDRDSNSNPDTDCYSNTQLHARAGRPVPNLPDVGVRLVGVYFPANGKFFAMGGRSADTAGSDFTNPFEFDPAAKLGYQGGDLSRQPGE